MHLEGQFITTIKHILKLLILVFKLRFIKTSQMTQGTNQVQVWGKDFESQKAENNMSLHSKNLQQPFLYDN